MRLIWERCLWRRSLRLRSPRFPLRLPRHPVLSHPHPNRPGLVAMRRPRRPLARARSNRAVRVYMSEGLEGHSGGQAGCADPDIGLIDNIEFTIYR